MIVPSLLFFALLLSHGWALLEEFQVRGPGEQHSAALEEYLRHIREHPEDRELRGDDNPVLRRAREYAVKRFAARSEESLHVQVPVFHLSTYLAVKDEQSFCIIEVILIAVRDGNLLNMI